MTENSLSQTHTSSQVNDKEFFQKQNAEEKFHPLKYILQKYNYNESIILSYVIYQLSKDKTKYTIELDGFLWFTASRETVMNFLEISTASFDHSMKKLKKDGILITRKRNSKPLLWRIDKQSLEFMCKEYNEIKDKDVNRQKCLVELSKNAQLLNDNQANLLENDATDKESNINRVYTTYIHRCESTQQEINSLENGDAMNPLFDIKQKTNSKEKEYAKSPWVEYWNSQIPKEFRLKGNTKGYNLVHNFLNAVRQYRAGVGAFAIDENYITKEKIKAFNQPLATPISVNGKLVRPESEMYEIISTVAAVCLPEYLPANKKPIQANKAGFFWNNYKMNTSMFLKYLLDYGIHRRFDLVAQEKLQEMNGDIETIYNVFCEIWKDKNGLDDNKEIPPTVSIQMAKHAEDFIVFVNNTPHIWNNIHDAQDLANHYRNVCKPKAWDNITPNAFKNEGRFCNIINYHFKAM